MDLTIIFNSYLAIFGEPLYAGLVLVAFIMGLLVVMGASIDTIILIMLPTLSLMVVGYALISNSILFIAVVIVGVIIGMGLYKMNR